MTRRREPIDFTTSRRERATEAAAAHEQERRDRWQRLCERDTPTPEQAEQDRAARAARRAAEKEWMRLG